jgi:hypothetical protein
MQRASPGLVRENKEDIMANSIEFRACEAWLCQVLGERQCKVWLQDPRAIAYDASRAVTVDLTMTPAKQLPAHPEKVKVDDFILAETGQPAGLTTLGPRWPRSYRGSDPHIHAAAAAVWLEASFWDVMKNEGKVLSHPQGQRTQDYQWKSRLYPDVDVKNWRRYLGCHARERSVVGSRYTFDLWGPLDMSPYTQITVDLNDPEQVDQSSSQPRPGSTQGEWILYLRWSYLRSINFLTPKLPLGEAAGGGLFPSGECAPEGALASRVQGMPSG